MTITNKLFQSKIQQPFFLTFVCLWWLLVPSVFAGEHGWKNMHADNYSSSVNNDNTINQNRRDLNAVYRHADFLKKEGRYAEVLRVYEEALKYHSGNPVLQRKRILAESDLREKNYLAATESKKSDAENASVTYALDQIKCRTLRGQEGVSACQRLQRTNTKLQSGSPSIQPQTIQEPVKEVNRYGGTNNQIASASSLRGTLRGIDLGNFHALVIGNNRYRHFPRLETAVQDAKSVAALLEKKYGYRVTQLRNANRYKIFEALSRLRQQLKADDNLLIYYAGHGYLDEKTKRGYWLPVDAEADNYANWLSTNDITDMLNGMSAKHILVVADSCYSGTLTRGVQLAETQLAPDQFAWIQRINNKKSRTVMTSGGLEPVLDSGNGKHSIFAESFINSLSENTGVLEASQMFTQIRRSVVLNADQTPEYADIRKAGHEGGDFIFSRVN